MANYTNQGHVVTATPDGTSLQILFIHQDANRTEAIVRQTVAVMKSFAAVINANGNDKNGHQSNVNARPCNVIVLRNATNHPSVSDVIPHITVSVANTANWNLTPKKAVTAYHVYCKNNDVAQGYKEWWRTDSSGNKSINNQQAIIDINAALGTTWAL